jgi:tRNA threonylcarbamoyladenosine biosynthesis protein TsaB
MKLLALDTTMQACSAAVYEARTDRLLAERYEPMERGHAEALAPMIEEVLREAGCHPAELDRIAVTTGPGTFTGQRIGLAMARGLGLALGRPVVGLNSLAAIALNAWPGTQPLLVAADARLGEVYAALYGANGAELMPPAVVTINDIRHLLPHEPVGLLGSAASMLIQTLKDERLTHLSAGDLPRAAHFARFTAREPAPSTMPSPRYLRGAGAVPAKKPAWQSAAMVREAGPADLPAIAELHAASFDRPWTAKEWQTLMAMPGARASLAGRGAKPESVILIRQAAGEAEILTLCTAPDARRKGLAQELLASETARLRAEGTDSLFIEVAVSNEPALGLYRRAGFTEKGRRSNYYERPGGRHEDAIIMRKQLCQ